MKTGASRSKRSTSFSATMPSDCKFDHDRVLRDFLAQPANRAIGSRASACEFFEVFSRAYALLPVVFWSISTSATQLSTTMVFGWVNARYGVRSTTALEKFLNLLQISTTHLPEKARQSWRYSSSIKDYIRCLEKIMGIEWRTRRPLRITEPAPRMSSSGFSRTPLPSPTHRIKSEQIKEIRAKASLNQKLLDQASTSVFSTFSGLVFGLSQYVSPFLTISQLSSRTGTDIVA